MVTVQWLSIKSYDWTGIEARAPLPSNPFAQLQRLLWQFRPYEFATYEWHLFDSFKVSAS
jgi:hypothetical protein